MRKRTIKHLLYNIITGVVVLAPLLLIGIFAIHNPIADVHTYILSFDGIMAGVPFYSILDEIIGIDGLVPLIPQNMPYLLDYVAYIATYTVFAMIVRVLVFVPRLVNKWLDMWGVADEQ